MNPFDHDPDKNPQWKALVGYRIYRCDRCGTEKTIQTNHTGKVWNERCAGKCRRILNAHTNAERVLPYTGPHSYVCEAA